MSLLQLRLHQRENELAQLQQQVREQSSHSVAGGCQYQGERAASDSQGIKPCAAACGVIVRTGYCTGQQLLSLC